MPPSATSSSSPRGSAARPRPNQILLNQRAHAVVEGTVDVESVGELTLKGISRPVSAANVIGVSAAQPVSTTPH